VNRLTDSIADETDEDLTDDSTDEKCIADSSRDIGGVILRIEFLEDNLNGIKRHTSVRVSG
jgi:hypothetical protein